MKYQDFVIKNGIFIGDFENMYQNFEDPWDQSTREKNSFEKLYGLDIIEKNNFSNVLELGCGLGYYTSKIRSVTSNVTGVDISETAINKARSMHKNCNFLISDILNPNLYEDVDFIMMVEITWYVLDKLSEFKKIISKKSGCSFFHTLNMYPENQQQYGKEYFHDLEGLVAYFSDIINIEEFGQFSKKSYNGCTRTFFYGTIK